MTEPVTFKYRAFISYSHRDASWAKWLHAALEGYRIDKNLVGRRTSAGLVPGSLRPIFRDREDFSAGHSLTEQTAAALEAAECMIVLCSPDAARSQYVNEEIRRFKALGRADRVIPVIIGGEPGDPERDYFPPALRFKVAADGSLTHEREEPIAADARPQGDGKEIAKHKLVAGILGLGFDEIVRRAERARKRKNRFWAALAGIFLLLAVVASASTVYAYQKLIESEDRLDQAIEIATGLLAEAVNVSDRFGVPLDVTLGMLKRADAALNALIAKGIDSPKLRHRKAVMLILFAEIYGQFGQTDESLRHATEAKGLLLVLVRGEPDNELWQHSLAVSHLVLGQVLLIKREIESAVENLRAGLALTERLVADDPEDDDYQKDILRLRNSLGEALAFQGSIAAATESFQAAFKGVQQFAATLSIELNALLERYPSFVPHVTAAVDRLGQVLVLQGSFDAGRDTFRATLTIREYYASKYPHAPSWQIGVLDTRYRLANLHLDMGSTAEAMGQFREGLESAERLARTDPKNTSAQRNVTLYKDGVARTHLAQGSILDALALFRKNLASAREFAVRDAGNALWRGFVATGHERIGDALEAQADLAGALAEYESQRSIVARLVQSNPAELDWQANLAIAHFKIGDVLRAQGDRAAAASNHHGSLGLWERLAVRMPEIIQFQVGHMKARWRVLESEVQALEPYEAILSSLRRLRDEKKLTAEALKWLTEAERQFAAWLAQPQATSAPMVPSHAR